MHADVSSRTRFPTLFDRYSTRFGTKAQNPGINPERATNYEIGVSDTLVKSVKLSSAVFYSDLDNSIQNAFSGPNGNNSIVIYNADGDNCGRTRAALRQAFSSARSKNLRDEPSSQRTINAAPSPFL